MRNNIFLKSDELLFIRLFYFKFIFKLKHLNLHPENHFQKLSL